MDQKSLINQAYQLAYQYEQDYGSCPQCVLAAIQDTIGGIDEQVFKSAIVLAGGSALMGTGTCGALAGGMLALGAHYGRERKDFSNNSRKAYKLAKQLYEKFVSEFGSPICQCVQQVKFGRSYDFWQQKEYDAFLEAGGHNDKCPDVAGKAAMWTAEILLERLEKDKSSGTGTK